MRPDKPTRDILADQSSILTDQSAATAIEYGLIAALIAIAAIIAFQALGLNLVDVLTSASNAMDGAIA